MSKPEIQRYKYGYKDDGWGQRYLSLIEDAEGSVVRFSDHEPVMKSVAAERDSFRACLEGALYGDLDTMAAQSPDISRQVGTIAAERPMAIIAERNELLGLLREANETYYRFINDDPNAVSNLANIMYLVRETLERHKC